VLFAATLAAGTPVDRSDTGFNPFGIIAIGVGLIVLVILLITFRRR
jgi:LPXTG-motif cell wall-anchored protein